MLPFGDRRIDDCLNQGGLALGGLHAVHSAGLEAELGAVAAGFLACLLARLPDPRPILWISRKADLHAPGLLAHGLDPGRLIQLRAPDDLQALASMEAALRSGAVAAVVAEAGRLERLAPRRLQLACLSQGSTGFLLRRWPHGRPEANEASRALATALTGWRVAAAPSQAAAFGMPMAEPGPARWRLELLHARGGLEGAWIVQSGGRHDPHPVRVVAGLADPAAAAADAVAGRRHARQ